MTFSAFIFYAITTQLALTLVPTLLLSFLIVTLSIFSI